VERDSVNKVTYSYVTLLFLTSSVKYSHIARYSCEIEFETNRKNVPLDIIWVISKTTGIPLALWL